MKAELISVIVPVYQVVQYLEKCLDSILNQSYKNIEILLIDDASTDGSGAVCDFYQKIDRRIKVFHLDENRGLSAARNKGIEEAAGKFLAFVDGDDWIHPDFLYCLHKALTDTNCDLAQCKSELIFDKINMELSRVFDEPAQVYNYEVYFEFLSLILKEDCVVVWNKLYTADLFENIRFPEGRIHEDEFVTYKILCKAQKIAVIHSGMYYYRKRSDSITGVFSIKRYDAHLAFGEREKFFMERGEENLLKLTQKIHYNWILNNAPKFIESGYEELGRKLWQDKERLANKLENNTTENRVYLFPFSKVSLGSRVVLYGAGNVGKQFFSQIVKSSFCRLAAWVDKRAVELKQRGYPVNTFDEFKEIQERNSYDYVIIAIADIKIVFEVINMLTNEFAIPTYKIIAFIEEIESKYI